MIYFINSKKAVTPKQSAVHLFCQRITLGTNANPEPIFFGDVFAFVFPLEE